MVEVVDPPRKTSGIVQWNYSSWAMGCNSAAEVQRAQAELAKHGVRTEYDSNHEPIIRSKQHFREHARALGFHHRNGGYYDP